MDEKEVEEEKEDSQDGLVVDPVKSQEMWRIIFVPLVLVRCA